MTMVYQIHWVLISNSQLFPNTVTVGSTLKITWITKYLDLIHNVQAFPCLQMFWDPSGLIPAGIRNSYDFNHEASIYHRDEGRWITEH